MWGQVPWSIPTVLPCPFLKAIFAEVLLFLPAPSHSLFSQSSDFSFISKHSPARSFVWKLQWQPSCSSSGDLKLAHYPNQAGLLRVKRRTTRRAPQALHIWKSSTPVGRGQLCLLKHVLTFTFKNMISPALKTQRGTPGKPQMSIFVVPKSWIPWWSRHFSMWGLIYKNFLTKLSFFFF